ncbi:MAG: hypothetical protein WAT09_13545 [Paracoccaceae bacterium]
MHLTFTPIRHDQPMTLIRKGDVLILNGETFDFSPLPEGAVLPAAAIDSPWFAGPVRREAGILQVTLLLPHGTNAPEQALFPAAIDLSRDGPVALPPYAPKETLDVAH